jgi:hypothetical protein
LGRTPEAENSALLCPPCFYKVVNEPHLVPSFLAAIDGNNSLKLIDSAYQNGNTRADDRTLPSPHWIEPEEVDRFKDDVANLEERKVSRHSPLPIVLLSISLSQREKAVNQHYKDTITNLAADPDLTGDNA